MRLQKQREIEHVFAAKKSVGTKYFVLYFIENKMGHARLATVISKKCSKLAVVRNRIRRQIKEYLRLDSLSNDGFDFVVIARYRAPYLSNAECKQNLEKLFGRFLKYQPIS